ncbi:MAG TPA: carboxypeptidase-like regulatory domain-containing protein [candidate division Zixibacteria bacterium]|nr:carboxypeptidase-like regulatory domain-containing protein [candidate division Zixibacteria bacterium]
MRLWLIRIVLLAAGLLVVMKTSAGTGDMTGRVVDRDGRPLVSASVVLLQDGVIAGGQATDTAGCFSLNVPAESSELTLVVSAVGYRTERLSVKSGDFVDSITVKLENVTYQVESIKVAVAAGEESSEISMSSDEVDHRAVQSPIPSNLTSAIVAPSVARAGSAHSSKLRIHGTSPDYFINGVNVGRDPNHFGTFSIIPASVVDDIILQPRGTGAEFGLPAAVSLSTPESFAQPLTGSYSLSLIETNGSLAIGNERFFALGSLRKSVLDKLVHYLDLRSDRRTIPPTNFQDIFISTGWRPSDRTRLVVDQYHVRDYLSFELDGSTRNSDGVTVAQHAGEHLVSARFEYLGNRIMHRLSAAVRDGVEKYHADPVTRGTAASISDFSLRLEENTTLAQIDYQGSLINENDTWVVGVQTNHTLRRDYQMKQANWNFTPPDAVSDVPFVYQEELNSLYAKAEGSITGHDVAVYLSRKHEGERFSHEVGGRLERFDNLSDGIAATFRARFSYKTGEQSKLELFAGTFAASPIDRILQPYQVLVRDQLSRLTPVYSRLASAQFSYRSVKLGLFAKAINGLPVVGPDFSAVDEAGVAGEGFIRVTSSGQARFVGADVTYERNGLVGGKLDIYAFYNYVHAVQRTDGIETPYDLSAPHRLVIQTDYSFSKRLQAGINLAVRSGNAYTSYTVANYTTDADRYSDDYYRNYLSEENGERFPVNVSLDLHLSYSFGGSQLFFNVANATNHANAIVNAADGYVYDSGILPSIGYRLEF